jgi:hypothetical protein
MGRVVTLQLSSWRETANLPGRACLLPAAELMEMTAPFADAVATIFLGFLERVNSGARLFQGYGGSCRGSGPFRSKTITCELASSIINLMTKQRCGYVASGLAVAAPRIQIVLFRVPSACSFHDSRQVK